MKTLLSLLLPLLSVGALAPACDDTSSTPCDPAVTTCPVTGDDTSAPSDTTGGADITDASAADTTAAPDTLTADTSAPAIADWIVDGQWLEDRLDDPTIQVVDTRDEGAYNAARVPGALHVSVLDVRGTVDGISGQVAAPADVAAAFAAAGVAPDVTVVVVGEDTGTLPARLAWTFAYHGHDVRVLDGGWDAWVLRSQPTEGGFPQASPSTYPTPSPVADLRVDGAWVLAHHTDVDVHLVDARSASEFAGSHIPGALSVDWNRNVIGGVLRPRDDVAAFYSTLPTDETIVVYCASGTRASVTWLVLSWLGFDDVRLYDGSWAEWSQLAGAPVETQ